VSKFKTVTHWFAVGAVAVVGFIASPAGQAVVHQYPILSGVAGVIGVLSALYHSPKS
jgi:hypothetical protein